jgi:hypothetical protein
MKLPTMVLLHFYAMEQLWAADDMNKAVTDFREARSIRHAAELFKAPQTCLRRRIIAESNNKKSKGGQTVFTPGNKNCWAV